MTQLQPDNPFTAEPAGARALQGGFADPVFDAQAIFHALMMAMAEPASLHDLRAAIDPPAPLSPLSAALVCTLCDPDTPLWLAPELAADATVRAWLGFQTGAPLTDVPSAAAFALAGSAANLPPLASFAQGTDTYPDRSTTILLSVPDFGSGPQYVLQGPGIRTQTSLTVDGLPADIVAQWAANHARFPRGVDLVLAGPGRLAALPRSTRMTIREG